MACDTRAFNRFFHLMLEHGVYLAPASYEAGFMSSAHGEGDIAQTIAAASSPLPVFDGGSTYGFHYTARPFPQTRMRRLRANEFSRRLVRESQPEPGGLYLPGIRAGGQRPARGHSLHARHRAAQHRSAAGAGREIQQLGIPAIALFPVVAAERKSLLAEEAYNADGLVQRAVRALKDALPELGVITDVALDPFTTHGQDGIIDDSGYVLNDVTTEVLVKQALSHAQAGADVVAPSDMMDGRIGAIRSSWKATAFTTP